MDLLTALSELPRLVEDYKQTAAQLEKAQKELAALQNDQYVTWEWVCQYFGVTKPTAVAMLQQEKMLVYGQKIKRLKKSAVLRFAERNSLTVREVGQTD